MKCYQRDLYAILGLSVWLGLYAWTGATSFQPADSAEFLTVVAHRGVAHPPGYPLYTILGILAHWLIPGSVVQAMSLLAALISWGTLLGIYIAIRQLCRNRLAAFFAACIAGTSLHIWKHATHPEAFALLGFFAAWLSVVVLLALDPRRTEREKKYAWLAYPLLVGLASSHHHTIVLTAPMGMLLLYKLFLASQHRLPQRGMLLAAGLGLFLVGLSPYLYLLMAGSSTGIGSWGTIETFQQLWDHFLRKEFGTFQSGLYASDRPFWFHSWQYIKRATGVGGSFPFGLSAFWIAGFLFLFTKRWPLATGSSEDAPVQAWQRSIGWSWFACWVLAGLVFPTQLKMGQTPLDQYVAARFYLLPDVFLALFAGIAIHYLLERASILSQQKPEHDHETAPKRRLLQPLVVFTLAYLVIMGAVNQYNHASSRHRNWLETYARDLLRELPKGSLLLEADDEAVCFGVAYLQQVLKVRSDVRFVCLPLLGRQWYARHLRKAWPEFRYQWNAKRISSLALIRHYFKLGRPVHVTKLYNRSIQRIPWVPHGLSWRVWRSKTSPPPPPQVIERMLLRRYRKLMRQHPLPHRDHEPWPTRIVRRYSIPWLALAMTYRRARKFKAVRRCRQRARLWIPK